jgi:RNA recognition motif-containing protein
LLISRTNKLTDANAGIIAWFRLFVGDLSNDVSDDVLSNAFNQYPSFQKARVIRDRLSGKVCSFSVPPLWLHVN